MNVSFDFAALSYLNLWLKTDSKVCGLLRKKTDAAWQTGIALAAQEYRIARNALTQYDEGKGMPRFQPIVEAIRRVSRQDFIHDPIRGILDVEEAISRAYGHRKMLSLTTKLLWFRLQSSNIIMYDKQARTALETKEGDVVAFYKKWNAEFERHRTAIDAACRSLVRARKYAIDTGVATVDRITNLAKQEWFQGRVFDLYLWHVGLER